MSHAPAHLRPTIHVVDPDAAVCDSLRSLLDLLDFPVETYSSAEQLLEKGNLAGRGCVVTEAQLPGTIRGTEIASRLRRRGLALPVIVLSNAGDVPVAVEALRGGAFDVIEKPFVDRLLVRRIEDAVRELRSA